MKSFLRFLSVLLMGAYGLMAKVFSMPALELGVTCNSLDTINNFFATAKNQFTMPIYNWIWQTNPFISLFQRSEFDYMDGLIPQVNTSTAELPTAYPFSLSNVGLSNGSGNSACVQSCTTVNDGYINRSFQLVQDCWETRKFCLTDLQFSWQAEQFAANLLKNMQNYTAVRWADWYRVQNIGMIDTKVSTGSGSSLDYNTDSNFNFTGVSLPTGYLNWDQLNCLYDTQTNIGAEAVGYAEGQPLYSLTVSPGTKRYLWQTVSQVRDTVNWGDAFQNFTARGINTSINGFIPNVDQWGIRYAANGTTPIYPWLNTNATVGRKFIANPDYKTVANGGLAVYETFTILPRNVYEVKVRPSGPTSFAGMTFDPVNYVGEPMWINNKDMCENVLGNMGFYKMLVAMAAKPVRPEIGVTGLTLARDC